MGVARLRGFRRPRLQPESAELLRPGEAMEVGYASRPRQSEGCGLVRQTKTRHQENPGACTAIVYGSCGFSREAQELSLCRAALVPSSRPQGHPRAQSTGSLFG